MIDEVCCLSDPSSHFSPMIKRGGERERIFLSVSLRREKEKRDNIAYLKEKKRSVQRLVNRIYWWVDDSGTISSIALHIDEQSSTFSLAYIYSLWYMCLFSTVHIHITVALLKILEIIKRSMEIIFFFYSDISIL